MGILDNFEAWVNFDDEEDESLSLKMFKEEVCDNCGCKDETSEDILSPQDPR